MRRLRSALLAASLAAIPAVAFSAETPKPCMGDAARLCPDVEPGGGAQIQCLKAHKEDLSPACKKKVMQAKIKMEEKKELGRENKEMGRENTPTPTPSPTPAPTPAPQQ